MKKIQNIWIDKVVFTLIIFAISACGSLAQTGEPPKKAQELFNKGYTQLNYQEYALAEKYFIGAIDKFPQYADAYDGLGKTYQEQGKSALAIATYRQLLAIDPSHLFAKYELGNIYFEQEKMDSAAYFFELFIEENPSRDKFVTKANQKLLNVKFGKDAIQNPIEFNPKNVGSGINTNWEEYSPALTIDGNTMYFTRRNGQIPMHVQNEDIYYSTRENGVWTPAKSMGSPLNTPENEGAFSVSADGRYIFFTACNRPGGKGQCDIWLTLNKDGKWIEPLNIGAPINSKDWESQPSLSSDGRQLFFVSNRAGGKGGTDIYLSTFTDSGWSKPVNLGDDINTSLDEQFPFIHPDGKTLYFSSFGHPGMGESDLFVSHFGADGQWEKPINLGYPLNTNASEWNLIVARDGKTAYYSNNKMEGGKGGMDLYEFELPENMRAKQVSFVIGNVYDANTKAKLGANVELIPTNGDASTNTFAPQNTGKFVATLRGGKQYVVNIQKDGYLFYSATFDLPEMLGNEPYMLDVPLQSIKTGNTIVLKNVFFDTDKFDLKTSSHIELDKLVDFLAKNNTLKIEVSGHTDNVGNAAHNQRLSESRAKSVRDYLLTKGIASERIRYKGYGDTSPIDTNNSEAGRAVNRRTEFTIVN